MATKGKEHGQNVKEKRGTSSNPRPADSVAAQRRRSPTPAAAAAATDQKSASASASGGKQVPNYLKPTISSKLDPSATPSAKKQPFSDFTTPKPTPLTRRRSFDKPPSPSRIPKPNATSPNSTERSLRSSSFSSKTTPLSKPNLEKLSKSTKDVGRHSSLQEPIRSPNVRKSVVTNAKKHTGASTTNKASATKAPRSTISSPPNTIHDSSKLESLQKDEETSPTEVEEINDDQNSSAEFTPIEEDKERVDLPNDQTEIGESIELKHCNSSTLTEDHSIASQSVDMEESQGETPTEEHVNNNHQEGEEGNKIEEILGSPHPEQGTFVGELQVDGSEKKEAGEEIASGNPKEDSSEVKEEVDQSKEAPKDQAQVVRAPAKGSKAEGAEKVVKAKSSQGSNNAGKKDTAAYNDVIEETANKLREQRKNKVKALVGAFETVISLESDTTQE